MDLELISTRRCPFVQRSIITLRFKDVPHRVTYVDLEDPPGWFRDISPFGKVPVLRIDGERVLFESAVINEYVDEVTPGTLHPADPYRKALNRSWIEFGGAALGDTFALLTAREASEFEVIHRRLRESLARVEGVLGDGPFFNGADFALVDAAYAPLFVRLAIVTDLLGIGFWNDLPKVAAWSEALRALPAVAGAAAPELADLLRDLVVRSGAHGAGLLRGADA